MVPLKSVHLSAVYKLYSMNKLISQRYNLFGIRKLFFKLHVSAQDIQRETQSLGQEKTLN